MAITAACTSEEGDCPSPPVLAAPSTPVALSCIDGVEYRGELLFVECLKVHESHIGEEFLTDGGGTRYDGAYEIIGVHRDKAFLLSGGGCEWAIAYDKPISQSKWERIQQSRHVVLSVTPRRVHPGDLATVELRIPHEYWYDVLAEVTRGRNTVPVATLLADRRDARLLTRPPFYGRTLPGLRFLDSREWTWRVPNLQKGSYRLRKKVFTGEPPASSIASPPYVEVWANFHIGR